MAKAKGILSTDLREVAENHPDFGNLSPEESEEYILASREDPLIFGQFVFGWPPAPHHEEWMDFVMFDEDGNPATDDRGISAPPSWAKSNWIGVVLSAWTLGRNPSLHIIYTSKSGALCEKVSNAVRDTIETNPRFRAVFPNCVPNKDRGWGEKEWYLQRPNTGDKDASFFAVGIGGSIVGSRGDLIIIDDPQDKTTSGTTFQRQKAIDYIKEQVMTRKTKDGRAIIIMTRWHPDDVAGFYIKEGVKWLILPALWCKNCHEASCHCGKKRTVSTWPDERPKKALLEIREKDPVLFEKIYQGNPRNATNQLFDDKMWALYNRNKPPDMIFRVMVADTAQKEEEQSSYSVIAHWGKSNTGNYYLLDLYRDRPGFPELLRVTKELYYELLPNELWIEEKSSGVQLCQSIEAETGIPIQRIKPQESKWDRARAISPIQKAGKCYIPEDAPWAYDFVEEHADFIGTFTDQVDTTAHALLILRGISTEFDDSPAALTEPVVRFRGLNEYGRISGPEAVSLDWTTTRQTRGSRWRKFSRERPGGYYEEEDAYLSGY